MLDEISGLLGKLVFDLGQDGFEASLEPREAFFDQLHPVFDELGHAATDGLELAFGGFERHKGIALCIIELGLDRLRQFDTLDLQLLEGENGGADANVKCIASGFGDGIDGQISHGELLRGIVGGPAVPLACFPSYALCITVASTSRAT